MTVHYDEAGNILYTEEETQEALSVLEAYEINRLQNQNTVLVEHTITNSVANVTQNVPEICQHSIPLINGDYYRQLEHKFICMREGRYNLEALTEGKLSAPLADALLITEIEYWAEVTRQGVSLFSFVLGHAYAQRQGPIGGPYHNTHLYAWSISNALPVNLYEGDWVQTYWKHNGIAPITFFERLYTRLGLKKYGDLFTETDCCT